jgi:hypothetical protein
MSAFRDLTNQTFGRLTALWCAGRNRFGGAVWLCRCVCGNESEVESASLVADLTRSCGCLRDEVGGARLAVMLTNQKGKNHPSFKHGHAMRSRVSPTFNPAFPF